MGEREKERDEVIKQESKLDSVNELLDVETSNITYFILVSTHCEGTWLSG